MAQKRDWRQETRSFVLALDVPFRLEKLAATVGAGTRRSLVQYLAETGLALTSDFDVYTPSWVHFRDARCLIRPQHWELRSGVLVPGHRFLPLYNILRMPTEIRLQLDGTGGRRKNGDPSLPRRTIAVPLPDAASCFELFGQESFFPLLGAEDSANANVEPADGRDAIVRLSAFDMGDFYRNTGFSEGDYLRCRVLDWEEGVFSAERVSSEDVTHCREHWFRKMEEAFKAAFEFFGHPMDIPSQLLSAHFFLEYSALTNPGGTLGELLEAENDLQFVSRGINQSAIWNAPNPPDDIPITFDHEVQPIEGVTGDLDEILVDTGSSLNAEEVEAFMRDALFHGRDREYAVRRAFQKSHLTFAHEAQASSFEEELETLWDTVSEEYVPARDATVGPIRRRLLDLFVEHMLWIRSLDERGADPACLPVAAMRDVLEFFNMISNAIILLNEELITADGADSGELVKLAEQVPQLERVGSELLQMAEDAVRDSLPRKKGKAAASGSGSRRKPGRKRKKK